jgi:acyl carrier protein phosphodiesterase
LIITSDWEVAVEHGYTAQPICGQLFAQVVKNAPEGKYASDLKASTMIKRRESTNNDAKRRNITLEPRLAFKDRPSSVSANL